MLYSGVFFPPFLIPQHHHAHVSTLAHWPSLLPSTDYCLMAAWIGHKLDRALFFNSWLPAAGRLNAASHYHVHHGNVEALMKFPWLAFSKALTSRLLARHCFMPWKAHWRVVTLILRTVQSGQRGGGGITEISQKMKFKAKWFIVKKKCSEIIFFFLKEMK